MITDTGNTILTIRTAKEGDFEVSAKLSWSGFAIGEMTRAHVRGAATLLLTILDEIDTSGLSQSDIKEVLQSLANDVVDSAMALRSGDVPNLSVSM